MARKIGKLTAIFVRNQTKRGHYSDGGGLYLQVTAAGAKTWIFRFMLRGKRRDMGLGAVHTVSLAEAREEARRCRQVLREGIDPIKEREDRRRKARKSEEESKTFKECAEAYIRTHEAGWNNAKHAAQWTSTLERYVFPVIGNHEVADVDTGLVMRVLEPIWATKTETASRVRGRMEAILDWATVAEYRAGENPARWKGRLDHLLPARGKVQKVGHHAALPYEEISSFMVTLREQDGVAARALEFAIYTAARTSEVIGAKWDEFDLKKRLWVLPAERMKAGKEHRVPLSEPAMAIIKKLQDERQGDFAFPGQNPKRPLSNMALLSTLRRMKRADITVHGFRSTFRDWVAEQTDFPGEVAEMALAHTVGDKVEAAYRRGDLFEKRRNLMAAWANNCSGYS